MDEEAELMKKIMGFNKFDTTKVSVITVPSTVLTLYVYIM